MSEYLEKMAQLLDDAKHQPEYKEFLEELETNLDIKIESDAKQERLLRLSWTMGYLAGVKACEHE